MRADRVEKAEVDGGGLGVEREGIGMDEGHVEGFEQTVLEGARITIARERPNLLIEIEEAHTNIPIGDAVRQVEALGYRCHYLRRGELAPYAQFDAETDHRNPRSGADYVFNFIFLPEPPYPGTA